jgi:hypothetical protein
VLIFWTTDLAAESPFRRRELRTRIAGMAKARGRREGWRLQKRVDLVTQHANLRSTLRSDSLACYLPYILFISGCEPSRGEIRE